MLIRVNSASGMIGYSIHRHAMPATAQLHDAAIAIGFRILGELCGPAWTPLAVQLAHPCPTDKRPYRRMLGPNIQFDAGISGIAFSSSWLDKPIAGADPALRDVIWGVLTQDQPTKPFTFSETVQEVLQQMLLSGTSAAEDVAQLFGIHERTLRKRL